MHFSAFWSSFGLGMDSTGMEQGEGTKLKTKIGYEYAKEMKEINSRQGR